MYKGYKQDKIEMRGDRAEMSDFPLYLNTVAGGLDRRDQTIGGFSFVVKIYGVAVGGDTLDQHRIDGDTD